VRLSASSCWDAITFDERRKMESPGDGIWTGRFWKLDERWVASGSRIPDGQRIAGGLVERREEVWCEGTRRLARARSAVALPVDGGGAEPATSDMCSTSQWTRGAQRGDLAGAAQVRDVFGAEPEALRGGAGADVAGRVGGAGVVLRFSGGTKRRRSPEPTNVAMHAGRAGQGRRNVAAQRSP
jgi:hypothetical protein